MESIKKGDRVRFYSPDGIHEGVVLTMATVYGSPYASIKPDDSEDVKYLFYGAVEGFERVEEQNHPWSRVMMARYRMMRLT